VTDENAQLKRDRLYATSSELEQETASQPQQGSSRFQSQAERFMSKLGSSRNKKVKSESGIVHVNASTSEVHQSSAPNEPHGNLNTTTVSQRAENGQTIEHGTTMTFSTASTGNSDNMRKSQNERSISPSHGMNSNSSNNVREVKVDIGFETETVGTCSSVPGTSASGDSYSQV